MAYTRIVPCTIAGREKERILNSMEQHTAKHFALQLGALISLYVSISFLLVLLFGIITLLFPATGEGYYERTAATDSIRLGIAMVVVFFPAYLFLTRVVNKTRRAATQQDSAYLGLTKWLLYLSLLVGGLVLLGDLATTIMTYLNGDLTVRFALKALAVLVVTGGAFFYYLMDVRGVWLVREQASIVYGTAAAVVILASVVIGVTRIDTPSEMRERKIDESQLQSLQVIQADIIAYTQGKGALPKTLSELNGDPITYTAPTGRTPYEYTVTQNGFSLCAEFALPSIEGDSRYNTYWVDTPGVFNASDWHHTNGKACFERTVDIAVLRGKSETPVSTTPDSPEPIKAQGKE